MQKFEIQEGSRVHALGSTRAGLLIATLKGMFASAGPVSVDGAVEVKRVFKLEAPDANALLVLFLSTALSSSRANNEAYQDVAFTLITDKKAEGEVVGKPVASFERPLTGVIGRGVDMKKNDAGNWEVTVSLE